jgi:hypothetical protein
VWDFLNDLVKTLLGANFPKVAGFAGFLFILLGVIPGEIRWGRLVFPRRDPLGRGLAIVLGTMFVAVPLLSLNFGSTIGFINVGSDSTTENSNFPLNTQPTSNLFIGIAQAASRRGSYIIPQRTIADTTASLNSVPSAIYVGDVHLSDPTVILIFRSDNPNATMISTGRDYSEAEIREILSAPDIILLKSFKQGEQQTFSYNGKIYILKVDRVIWFLIGDDTVTLSINPQ